MTNKELNPKDGVLQIEENGIKTKIFKGIENIKEIIIDKDISNIIFTTTNKANKIQINAEDINLQINSKDIIMKPITIDDINSILKRCHRTIEEDDKKIKKKLKLFLSANLTPKEDKLIIPEIFELKELNIENKLNSLTIEDAYSIFKDITTDTLVLDNFKLNNESQVEALLSLINDTKCKSLELKNFNVEMFTEPPTLKYYFVLKKEDNNIYLYTTKDPNNKTQISSISFKNCPFIALKKIYPLISSNYTLNIDVDQNSFLSLPGKIKKFKKKDGVISLVYDDDLLTDEYINIESFLKEFPFSGVVIHSFKFKNIINITESITIVNNSIKIKYLSFVNCCEKFVSLIISSLDISELKGIYFTRIFNLTISLELFSDKIELGIKDSIIKLTKPNEEPKSIYLKKLKYQMIFQKPDLKFLDNFYQIDELKLNINKAKWDFASFTLPPELKVSKLVLEKQNINKNFTENSPLIVGLLKDKDELEIEYKKCMFDSDFQFTKKECLNIVPREKFPFIFFYDYTSFMSIIYRKKFKNFEDLLLATKYSSTSSVAKEFELIKQKGKLFDLYKGYNIYYKSPYEYTSIILTILTVFQDDLKNKNIEDGSIQTNQSNISNNSNPNNPMFSSSNNFQKVNEASVINPIMVNNSSSNTSSSPSSQKNSNFLEFFQSCYITMNEKDGKFDILTHSDHYMSQDLYNQFKDLCDFKKITLIKI